MSHRPLWFLVDHTNNNPVSFFVNAEVMISPYVHSHERGATAAVEDEVWAEAGDRMVARPGPPNLFLTALHAGFPNTVPKPPDCFSLNGEPGKLLGGLVPVTPRGAAFVDEQNGTQFWTLLDQVELTKHAEEVVKLALGLSSPN